MFSLIITIISIALVVALIAATAYYGGDTLTEGRISADAASYVAGGQQLAGSIHTFIINEDKAPDDVSDLMVKNLLITPPNVKSRSVTNEWLFDTLADKRIVLINFAGAREDNQRLCEKINKNAGATAINLDTGAVSPAQAESMHYACVDFDDELPQTFVYKY